MWNTLARRRRPAVAPALPLLTHLRSLEPADWLRASMTTFAESVASLLPGGFEAYARLYHPWEPNNDASGPPPTWRELAAAAGTDLADLVAVDALMQQMQDRAFVIGGSLPVAAIEPLLEHLRPATGTPERCFFALWDGFGGAVLLELGSPSAGQQVVEPLVPSDLEPKLELPYRHYHVFSGPLEGALTNYADPRLLHHQSANLWWPADRAWCVASEVDHPWTYVGASRACVAAVLADPRLEAAETRAAARW